MSDRIRFYRCGGMVMMRGARVAHVSFGRSFATVSVTGATVTIPDLAAMGVHGCTRVDRCPGYVDAHFPRATQRVLLSQLREAFDAVVDERMITSYRLELEFVAALIEWGCGPLPTLAEINAYDRGVADARRAVAAEHAAELVRARADARNAAVATAANTSAELAELRATVERQRLELARRPVAVDGYERAERQRAADADRVRVLAETWSAEAERLAFSGDERAARIRENWAAAARTLTIEIRETEVVR